MTSGTLYLISTPIGNLEDITLRALRVLREVPRIACEDTRWTRKLLSHYDIRTPTFSLHAHNERARIPGLIRSLKGGENLAMVSDGGTPAISDPGLGLIRKALDTGVPVMPIPGASAPLAALVASGLPTDAFSFFGFLPHRKGERRKVLASVRDRKETLIFFDSPRRVRDSLADLAEILGDRFTVLCREITKIHEEFQRGPVSTLLSQFQPPLKGEVTLVVAGAPPPSPRPASPLTLRREIASLVETAGMAPKDAIREVARRRLLSRREVYQAWHHKSGPEEEGSPKG